VKITFRELTRASGTSLMLVREAVQRLAAEDALEVLRAIRVPVMTKSGILRLRWPSVTSSSLRY
jgi:DNA-binding GntR family transcriptional regulator